MTRLATLCSLLLAAPVSAQTISPLAHLLAPPPLVHAPDVVLTRDTGERRVQLVTDGRTSAAQLARRYGVARSRLTSLGGARGVRVWGLALAPVTAQRASAKPASVETYRVRPGDTLAGVAARFGLPLVDLLGVNLDRTSLDRLIPGTALNIPTGPRGLLVRIKPGQSALSLIAGYGADLVATAQANDVLPTELRVGDTLLLPGIRAEGFAETLAQRREAERRAALLAQRQAQYERFLTWKKGRERARLEARYEAQERYEQYLAWKNSPERQARIQAYERQAQYEAAQAAAQARARAAASAQAVTPQASAQMAGTGSRTLAWPMRSYRLTSRYAERDIEFHRQVFHGGIDLAAPYGTPIYAAADGTVTESGYGDYGLNVYTTAGSSLLIYGHMSRAAVVAGQQVTQGQLLGYIGCTGICTGPHLHFEVRLSGQTVDPLALLP
ncbi:peptidoglycan DD-metalloendopeptidase family protein [Deinococcus sp. HMF7604]|uniref:peptidoglycan DD-metalloendopeptidase family protein n=1 Tax=Deinococcus betulae TaxID=2873312 RepID=UPI001CCE1B28|nr:peptidoglycan DD-metalloendopeptidase family protein [Deinococcus betulae]